MSAPANNNRVNAGQRKIAVHLHPYLTRISPSLFTLRGPGPHDPVWTIPSVLMRIWIDHDDWLRRNPVGTPPQTPFSYEAFQVRFNVHPRLSQTFLGTGATNEERKNTVGPSASARYWNLGEDAMVNQSRLRGRLLNSTKAQVWDAQNKTLLRYAYNNKLQALKRKSLGALSGPFGTSGSGPSAFGSSSPFKKPRVEKAPLGHTQQEDFDESLHMDFGTPEPIDWDSVGKGGAQGAGSGSPMLEGLEGLEELEEMEEDAPEEEPKNPTPTSHIPAKDLPKFSKVKKD
ncbi:hypothetical protein H0H81_008502 [Sphagnurus paluster]|uniref:Uncharacterized protein n=1 Tax=Sphagnurus paluster TaxID=117069 RepID=A0A9P7GG41_9AGAR|nr:hypothetical protein H0H81_008502 [Sphagnurus paluster]